MPRVLNTRGTSEEGEGEGEGEKERREGEGGGGRGREREGEGEEGGGGRGKGGEERGGVGEEKREGEEERREEEEKREGNKQIVIIIMENELTYMYIILYMYFKDTHTVHATQECSSIKCHITDSRTCTLQCVYFYRDLYNQILYR